MKDVVLVRKIADAKGTRGLLFIEGKQPFPTIEPEPERVRGAIPAGRYEVRMSWSPKFQTILPEVLRVPNRRGIRIHGGCRKEHTQGCICVPLERVKEVYDYVRKCTEKGEIVNLVVRGIGDDGSAVV